MVQNRYLLPLLASLTLGLAPFFPEPHLAEKLRWLASGERALEPVDLFDLALHGSPWLWLLVRLATGGAGAAVPGRKRFRAGLAVILALVLAALCVAYANLATS